MGFPFVWRKSESAPKGGEWFVVANSNERDIDLVRWMPEGVGPRPMPAGFENCAGEAITSFDYWMPLPKAPGRNR